MTPQGQVVAIAFLVLLNLWGFLMWRGTIGRDRIQKWARLENWGSPYFRAGSLGGSLSFVTTAAPAWAAAWDLFAIGWVAQDELGTNGRDFIAFATLAPGLIGFLVAYVVGAWDRPRWALPPWYRRWRAERDARGHDANHQVTVLVAEATDGKSEPYAFSQCECEWLGDIIPVKDGDYVAAIRAAVASARTHSHNLKPEIEFPLGRPAAAPRSVS